MNISMKDLRSALDAAADLSAQYAMYVQDHGPFKSLDDVRWIFTEYLGKTVRFLELDEPLPHGTIKGFYVAYKDGTYDVVLARGMEPDWQRYVLCKELFHVLLDHDECRTTNIWDHLEEVVMAFPVLESTPSPAVVSEVMAEFAAMEFLFPYRMRVMELAAGNTDFQRIAAKFRIPQVYVERYLSQHYMEFFGAFYGNGEEE